MVPFGNMANGSVLVTTSGAALSLLFYENVRSAGDQVGFLLGDTLTYVVKKFTDSDTQIETIKTHINVETVITCPTTDVFYDTTGRINKEKLNIFMSDRSKHIIGWFIFRKDINLVPTLRDKILHKQFASYFCNDNSAKQELFLTCLMSSAVSFMKGTHKFKQVFFRYKRGLFVPIPLRINNLGDGVSKHDGSDYKLTPATKSSEEPDAFTQLIETLNLDLTKTQGVASVTSIQKIAERHLSALIPQVCESDKQVADLEQQVKKLQAKSFLRNTNHNTNVNYNLDVGKNEPMFNEEPKILENVGSLSARTDTRDKTLEVVGLHKYYPTEQVPHVPVGNVKSTAATTVKNVNYEKSKRLCLTKEVQNNPRLNDSDPFENMVSEMKMDIVESAMNKNKRDTSTFTSISKQNISRVDSNDVPVGRNKGKPQKCESSLNLKKGKRTAALKNNIDRTLAGNSPGQKGGDSNFMQSSTPTYTQITKNADSTRNLSDTSDTV